MAYKSLKATKTKIICKVAYEGESIEQKVSRILNNKEPITDGAPITYTARKDGVNPQYDIRTDRWELAVDAMDNVQKAFIARREGKVVEMPKKEGNGGAEPIPATDNNQ